MINLPKWVQRVLDESVCPSCKAKADKMGIFAEGIREEVHSKTKQTYLSFFFLYMCLKCKKPSTFSCMPTSFDDFIGDMIEVANSVSPTTVDIKESSALHLSGLEDESENGISDKEVREFKKFLKSTKYFEDFLTQIGIDRSDIEKKDNK